MWVWWRGACMCVCVCARMHMCHLHACMCVCVCMCAVCMPAYVCVCECPWMCAGVHACVHVFVCVCVQRFTNACKGTAWMLTKVVSDRKKEGKKRIRKIGDRNKFKLKFVLKEDNIHGRQEWALPT